MFEKYYRINTVQYEEATPENCDERCETFHFCAQYSLDYSEFEMCVENRGERRALPALAALLSVLICFSFFHTELNKIY